MIHRLLLFSCCCLIAGFVYTQTPAIASGEPVSLPGLNLSEKYVSKVSSKMEYLEEKIDAATEKILKRLRKAEEKLQKKLIRVDSIAALKMLNEAKQAYSQLQGRLKNPSELTRYIPRLDSLGTSLAFLKRNAQLSKYTSAISSKLDIACKKMDAFKDQLKKSEQIKQFLKERRQLLKEQFEKLGLVKNLKKLNKDVFYYSRQLHELKEILNDPKRIEKKALELLSNTQIFKDFMKKHGMLASLFPGSSSNPGSVAQSGFAGLQTRVQLTNFIQNQSSSSSASFAAVLQNNIQSAQGVTDQLRNKLQGLIGSGDELEMPDFKPNNQKSKTFRQRIELSSNLQTEKANNFFPTTTDVGFSVGYKLNDKSIIGIGSSAKIGWGKGFDDIKVTGQGISLRSFIDLKLKHQIYASGGFEYNYQESFDDISQLYNVSVWKKSALLGISKELSLKGKLIKKAKLQLLYDFLHRQQLPITAPLKFRVAYVFN